MFDRLTHQIIYITWLIWQHESEFRDFRNIEEWLKLRVKDNEKEKEKWVQSWRG